MPMCKFYFKVGLLLKVELILFTLDRTHSLYLSAGKLTVCLTGCCTIVGTEARLHLPASNLQLMWIRQVGPTHVAHPLLLTRSALSHIDRHPGGPRSVPLYLWTCLQVTGLVLLNEKVAGVRGAVG